jgi:hypothetical protein
MRFIVISDYIGVEIEDYGKAKDLAIRLSLENKGRVMRICEIKEQVVTRERGKA